MNKPRLKLKEVLLMVLPVGVLAVIGISMRGKAGPTLQMSGPFKFVVEEMKIEPVTPGKAADGYSSTLIVILNHEGSTPGWWGKDRSLGSGCTNLIDPIRANEFGRYAQLGCWRIGGSLVYRQGKAFRAFVRNGNVNGVMISSGGPKWDTGLQRYVMEYNLALDKVPENVGEVTFKGVVAADLGAATPFSLAVRKAGKKPQTPATSKYSPIVVANTEVNISQGWLKVNLIDKEQSAQRTPAEERWTIGSPCLIDEAGNKYTTWGKTSGSMMTGSVMYDSKQQRYVAVYPFVTAPIPKSAGKVTLKAKISLNDYWPISISAVVRQRPKQSRQIPNRAPLKNL